MIVLLGLIADPVRATVYYVATTGSNSNPGSEGSPWLTMQKAADTMVAGDTTIVKNGTYTEDSLVFNTNGTVGARITLRAENQHQAILLSTSSCQPSINIQGSYITIDGLRISVSPSDVVCGPWNANTSMINMRVFPLAVHGVNEFSAKRGGWIKNVQIDSSVGHRYKGIGVAMDDVVIENNTVNDEIELFNSHNAIIRNNTIYAIDNGIIAKGGSRNAQFYNNIIHISGTYTTGIYVGGCTGAPYFYDTATKQENYNAAVYNNVIINDTPSLNNYGVVFSSDVNSKVFNNVIINTRPVVLALSCTINTPLNTNVNPTFVNNILIGNGATDVGSLTAFSGTKTIDYNNFFNFASGVPTQAHAITGNPNLINSASDWHTQAGSPAIGSGTTIAITGFKGEVLVTNMDRDGKLRTAPWDLGIYATNGGASDITPPVAPVNVRIQ
jgi:chondroitinase B-like protein